ncbi:hypothetical protein BGZ60DRAFT_525419 [Tricladium varicosporioides]|nr:hypothetical protein BGZ60DRAFT_525419 [Hymenoscyphus varicosporioides]
MAILQTVIVTLAALSSLSLASPTPEPVLNSRATCTNPVKRKEWSAATAAERASYTKAVLCLATKPSRIGLATTLYDDFAWVHNKLNLRIHGVAQFLPWHRYFISVYEQALKDCGYTGNAMYWNWAADSAAPASAKVWSPVDGFGGNGNLTLTDTFTHCITNGPFTSLRPAYYNNDTIPHCILRDFMPAIPQASPPLQEMLGFAYTQAIVDEISTTNTNFGTFHGELESRPHGAVHAGIAQGDGDMGPITSPNDPIFFLHHTMVDRVWWLWQQADPTNRLNDFSGTEFGGVTATLDDVMPMLGLATDRKVRDFMSTGVGASTLCYTY